MSSILTSFGDLASSSKRRNIGRRMVEFEDDHPARSEQSTRLRKQLRDVQHMVVATSRPGLVMPIFTGTYKFDHYDEKLEDFLESLGLSPVEFGPVVRGAELRVSVRAPYIGSSDRRWTVTHYETVDDVEVSTAASFELDKPYSAQRNGVDEITLCTQTQENTILYQSQVPSKGWKIENLAIFTKEGITAFLKNVNKNVITTKYYTRTHFEAL